MLKEQFQKALNSIHSSLLNSELSKSSPENKKYLVAYSGGLDSHVLLHLCAKAKLNTRAVYINHGLQTDADNWQQHCQTVCDQLQIEFESIGVDARARTGQSPEEAARNARYTALKKHLKKQEYLLTAHHQEDQAETLLLQLMRGAGTAGLASMPAVQIFGNGYHCRPMLDCARDAIKQYADQEKLRWVEDPSNNDTSFDRNFIRQQVIPILQKRWPQVNSVIKKSAEIQQENLELIHAIAAIDLASIITKNQRIISIRQLCKLSTARQFNVLKFWIKNSALDKPTRNVLTQIQSSVLTAMEDAEPLVAWANTEVRRFKDELYVMPSLNQHDEEKVLLWNAEKNMQLNNLDVFITVKRNVVNGLSPDCLDKKLEIKFRRGGEKIKPAGQQHTSSLKNLMQQKEIPPWCRSRIPLLYIDDVLACVCGYWVADEFADKGKGGWMPVLKNMH